MNPIGDIMLLMMTNLGMDKRFRAEIAMLHWRQIVGEDIASHTRPLRVRRGVMTVAAKNAMWVHHLSTLKEKIVAKINAFAGENAVRELKFQAGYFQNDQNEEKDDGEDKSPYLGQQILLEKSDLTAVEEMAAPLVNEALRQKIKKLLCREMALRRVKRRQDWRPCQVCGVLRPPEAALCTACSIAARTKSKEELRRVLREAPWLGYEECASYVPCRRSDFASVKDEMADTLLREIGENGEDWLKIMALAMLLNGVGPRDVTGEMVEKILAMAGRKGNVFASRG